LNVVGIHLAKRLARLVLRRIGYQKQPAKRTESLEFLTARAGKDSFAYKPYSAPWPIFSPWTFGDFHDSYLPIAQVSPGSPERAYTLCALARYAKHLPGDFAESGVYKGGSAYLLCRNLQDSNKKLYLFDSFQGLPKPNAEQDRFFKEGEFSAPLAAAQERLKAFQHLTDFRQGWIPDVFVGLETNRYAFAHVDVDLYQPTLDSCKYFYPRMTAGAVILFDEYGFASAHGEKVAVDEFFADKPEQPIVLITGQAFVLKLSQI
jgi:O-methyltransferase